MTRLLLLLLLVSLLLSVVLCNEEEEEEDQLDTEEQEVGPAPGVQVNTIFTSHNGRKFPAGDTVEALIGFDNGNNQPFSVDYIRGALTSPMDFTYVIQNFTGLLYNTSVSPDEAACMMYRFKPDQNLDPREYGLYITVFYVNEENDTHISTAFNGTIDIADPVSSMDARTFFMYIFLAGIAGLGGYFVYMKSNSGRRRRPVKSRSQGGSVQAAPEDDKDFLPGNVTRFHEQSRKASASPKRKQSSSPARKKS